MPTLQIDAAHCGVARLQPAVDWLGLERIVALPTDTFYGLAVDPTSERAVHDLFELKGRESRAALPLIAASLAQVEALCGRLSVVSARLAAAFWPGPLSLICDAPARIAPAVHGGTRTLAVRVPAHPVARALTEAWGSPLTATSANPSGASAPATAGALAPLLGSEHQARIFVIDAGPTTGGAPSTIVDARGAAPVLIRAGAIAWDRVLESLQG